MYSNLIKKTVFTKSNIIKEYLAFILYILNNKDSIKNIIKSNDTRKQKFRIKNWKYHIQN